MENTEKRNFSIEPEKAKEKVSTKIEYKGFIHSVFGNQVIVYIPKFGKFRMEATKLFDETGNCLSNAKANDLILKPVILSEGKAVLTDPSKIDFFGHKKNEKGEER